MKVGDLVARRTTRQISLTRKSRRKTATVTRILRGGGWDGWVEISPALGELTRWQIFDLELLSSSRDAQQNPSSGHQQKQHSLPNAQQSMDSQLLRVAREKFLFPAIKGGKGFG